MHVALRSTHRVRLMCGAVALAAIAVPATAFAGDAPPTITSVSPSTVSTSGGTTVTITGTNLYSYPWAISSLLIDGQTVTGWSIINPTHISAVVPAHAAGVVNIRWNQPQGGPTVHADLNGALTYVVLAPNTPNAPAAAAGDGQAVVTVAASPGGQAATSHLVTASPGGATCTVSAATGSCTIIGLSNGTAYRFSDTAINTGGSSSESALSSAVTPTAGATSPAAPADNTPVVVPAASVPPLKKMLVSGGTGGTYTTTGLVPDGATSVAQSATSGGATSAEVLRHRARSHARVAARCPITTSGGIRTFRCRLTLGRGRWTLVTQAKHDSSVVAQSLRVVVVRRAAHRAVTG